MKKTLVVSAIALHEGGPLTVLKDCLASLSGQLSDRYRIIALVHDAARLPAEKNIEYREYGKARRNWLYRFYYEYVHFFFLSRRLRPHLWLSLHDITPPVKAEVRAVYCHNPSPFYSFSLRVLAVSPTVALFSLFYKYLYRINIRRNNYVIVQQDWIRTAFERMYGIRDVVVANPVIRSVPVPTVPAEPCSRPMFLYPAFPRVFKNLEAVAEAAKLLHDEGRNDFEVILTINGTENAYARRVVSRYQDIPVISFIGLRPLEEIHRLYGMASALIFASKLETWGLPISEFKTYKKPMLLPDLPYARETVGDYDQVKFYNADDPRQLADHMQNLMDGKLIFDGNRRAEVREPVARDWEQLFGILLNEKQVAHA